MPLLSLTYDFLTATGSIVAAQFGQNFADIAAVLNGGIRSENMAPDAGITSNQLASRFAPQEVTFHLLPPVSDGTIDGSENGFTITDVVGIAWHTRRIKCQTGKQKFLCGISIHLQSWSTQEFEVTAYRNGTAIAGAVFIFDGSDQYVEMENTDMFADPFAAFVNNDELEYRLRATTSGAVVRNCTVTENWKTEHVA